MGRGRETNQFDISVWSFLSLRRWCAEALKCIITPENQLMAVQRAKAMEILVDFSQIGEQKLSIMPHSWENVHPSSIPLHIICISH